MRKVILLSLVVLCFVFSQIFAPDRIANAAQIYDAILTNENTYNYECNKNILPPAVSIFDASTDYAVYLYLIVENIEAGDTENVVWYYENEIYTEQPDTYSEAGSFCLSFRLTLKRTQAACKTGNWKVEYYLNNQKLVTKSFYLEGISCEGSSCLAEAVLENDAESLNILRDFRDNVLLKSERGEKLAALYYQCSPMAIKLIEDKPELKKQLKQQIKILMPTIKKMLRSKRVAFK